MNNKIPSTIKRITPKKMILAVETGDILAVNQGIDEGFNLSMQFIKKGNGSLLHLAVAANQPHVVERLIQANFDTELSDSKSRIAIEYAILANNVPIIDIFIRYNKLPNSLLLSSICRNDLNLFENTIRNSHQISDENEDHFYLLHYLAALGRYESMICLKNHIGISHLINTVTVEGVTPLTLACQYTHENMVEFLLKEGAKVSQKNDEDSDALYFSIKNAHLKIMQLLLNALKDPLYTLRKRKKNSVFSYLEIIFRNKHTEIALFLIRKYPELLAIHDLESSIAPYHCLHLASLFGLTAVVEEILASGISADLQNKNGQTPLNCTLIFDEVETFELLCRHKANLYHETKEGNTLFMQAAENGANKILGYCLNQFSVPIEAINKKQETALTLAAGQGNVATLQLLLAHKANIHHTNIYGAGVLHKAAYYANFRNVLYLIREHHIAVEKQTKSGDFPLDVCLQGKHYHLAERQHTILYLLAFMFDHDLKLGLRHLILLDAYSQRLIFFTSSTAFSHTSSLSTKSFSSIYNIRSNHRSQAVLAQVTGNFLVSLQMNLFEYVLLFFTKNNIFLQLPREVFITNILCDVLKYSTNNLLSFEDSYLIANLLTHIERKVKAIRHAYSPKKKTPLMQSFPDHNNANYLLEYVTVKPTHFSYAKIYNGLLRWIEILGHEKINDTLPAQCDSLFLHRTPLTAAIEGGFEQLVWYCLQQGANPNQPDKMGQYPLHLICHLGHQAMFSMLLSHHLNTSLQRKNEKGNYPLHEAILGKQKTIVEALLIYFYDKPNIDLSLKPWEKINILEQKNEFGETPFELAYMTAQLDIIECLLERHASFYRYIGKDNHYLSLPSTPTDFQEFKYKPAWITQKKSTFMQLFKTSQALQAFNINNFQAALSLLETQKKVIDIQIPPAFYALKFLVVSLLEHLMQIIPYPTTQFEMLQDFLLYFSFKYMLSKKDLEYFFKMSQLLISFQQAANTSKFFDALNVFRPKNSEIEEMATMESQIHFNIKTACQYIAKITTDTTLMQEALMIRLKNDYPSFFMPQKPQDYAQIFALHISAAGQLNSEKTRMSDNFFHYFQSALGILYDFYSIFSEAHTYNKEIRHLFLLSDASYFSTYKKFLYALEDFCDDIFMLGEDIIYPPFENERKNDSHEELMDDTSDSVSEDSRTHTFSSDEESNDVKINKKNKSERVTHILHLLSALGEAKPEIPNAAILESKVIDGLINFSFMKENRPCMDNSIIFPKPIDLNPTTTQRPSFLRQ